MNYDPLVHDYVKGKMIGGVLGILIGVGLIVASCQYERSKPNEDTPTPQVEYKCDRWKAIWCELRPEWGEM